MSPVVRVHAGTPPPPALELPELARALPLSLAELLAAARAAGDVPLPFGQPDAGDWAGGGRLARRLGARDPDLARLEESLDAARVGGPAEESLADRGLLVDSTVGGALVAEPAAALQVLAGGRSRAVLDLAVRGGPGLHCWLGVEGRLVARLATSDGLAHELAWYDAGLWNRELARVVTLGAPDDDAGSDGDRPLPAYAALPSDQVAAALAAPSARLRVVAGSPGTTKVGSLAWLRLGGAWHELARGPGATTVVRRRTPYDLGPRLRSVLGATGGWPR